MRKALFSALFVLAACQPAPHSQTTAEKASAHPATTDPVRQLSCKGASDFKTFSATLDGSVFDAGSGFFDVTNANVVDNYATARLICTGHALDAIDCVGFWFDLGGHVAEVTVAKDETGGYSASYSSLKGAGRLGGLAGGPWPCTVQ